MSKLRVIGELLQAVSDLKAQLNGWKKTLATQPNTCWDSQEIYHVNSKNLNP